MVISRANTVGWRCAPASRLVQTPRRSVGPRFEAGGQHHGIAQGAVAEENGPGAVDLSLPAGRPQFGHAGCLQEPSLHGVAH